MADEWNRPYTPGSGRWLVIGWEAVAIGLLAWASVDLLELRGAGLRLFALVMAALWVVLGWRILEMGVYVRPAGLQIRGLLRSRTLRWGDIAHVRLHRHTSKLGRFRIEDGMTVLIERRDGSMIDTELWAQGIDFHRRQHVFREVYHELRNRHLTAARAES